MRLAGCLHELTRLVVQSNQLVSLPWQIGSVALSLSLSSSHVLLGVSVTYVVVSVNTPLT